MKAGSITWRFPGMAARLSPRAPSHFRIWNLNDGKAIKKYGSDSLAKRAFSRRMKRHLPRSAGTGNGDAAQRQERRGPGKGLGTERLRRFTGRNAVSSDSGRLIRVFPSGSTNRRTTTISNASASSFANGMTNPIRSGNKPARKSGPRLVDRTRAGQAHESINIGQVRTSPTCPRTVAYPATHCDPAGPWRRSRMARLFAGRQDPRQCCPRRKHAPLEFRQLAGSRGISIAPFRLKALTCRTRARE